MDKVRDVRPTLQGVPLPGARRNEVLLALLCWAAQRAFTRALADGRLNGILAEERARAKVEAQRNRAHRSGVHWRGGVETAYDRQVRELGSALED